MKYRIFTVSMAFVKAAAFAACLLASACTKDDRAAARDLASKLGEVELKDGDRSARLTFK
jgi:hypothetical protein